MDDAALRATFDEQVRRRTQAGEPGACIETDGAGRPCRSPAMATAGPASPGRSWLTRPTADQAIAAQIQYFAGLGRPFEWKLYDYDQPPDLGGPAHGGRVRAR